MTLDAFVAALEEDGDGRLTAAIPENWTQGRTLYGGATAALALAAARRSMPDLPPLRSVQVAFIGPIADRVSFAATALRRGRSASFVAVEAWSGETLGARLLFVFADDRPSAVDQAAAAAPPPSQGDPLVVPEQVRFAQNFDHWFAGDGTDLCDRWVRAKAPSALDAEIELLAVADLLPPPALFDFGGFVPLSSISWQVDLLAPARRSADGRWRLVSAKEMNAGGLSTQTMRVDDGEGRPVARGRQLVALFG